MTQIIKPEDSLIDVCREASVLVEHYLHGSPKENGISEGQLCVKQSLEVIKESLDRYKFDQLALSFNGGKDCLVLLILLMTGLYRKWQEDPSYLSGGQSISCVYVQSRNAFQEVDDFVEACNKKYHLDTTTLTMGMKEALACFLERNSKVKAIFVGIRRTDPFGAELKFFQQTDHGWPDFIRIHPVIDWHLKHIWEFLRFLEIPYCSLYDEGYTSLGGTDNTIRNPDLRVVSIDGNQSYLPAYTLDDDLKERLGRT